MFLIIAHLFCADVKKELDELSLTVKNFESRVSFAKDWETMSAVSSCVTITVQLRFAGRFQSRNSRKKPAG